MTMRDKGPIYNVGFGVTTRQDLSWDPDETTLENPNPESGPVAKLLHGNPIARFLAVGAATMVGATVAGKVVRSGGIKIGAAAEEFISTRYGDRGAQWVTNNARSVQALRKELDALQGVTREFAENRASGEDKVGYETVNRLFKKDASGRVYTDKIDNHSGFFLTSEEVKAAGTNKRGALAGEEYIDAIQKRMVSQARRLPYELPAAYVFDNLFTNRMLEGDNDSPNWSNPADVISDIVTESVKNVAFAFAPFEVGTATGSTAYKRFMAYGDDLANINPNAVSPKYVDRARRSVAVKNILAEVGHDASQVLNKAVRLSAQSSGAVSTTISEAQKSSKTLVSYLHDVRNGSARIKNQNLTSSERVKRVLMGDNDGFPAVLDYGPGALKGLRSGVAKGREAFRNIGEDFSAYEKMLEVGAPKFKRNFADQVFEGSGRTYSDALGSHFGRRANTGGNTGFENLAYSLRDLGSGGPETGPQSNKSWYNSKFYTNQLDNEYRRLLTQFINTDKSVRTGKFGDDFANRIVEQVNIDQPSYQKNIKAVQDRIRFGKKQKSTKLTGQEYIDDVASNLTQFSTEERDFFRQNIGSIMDKADAQFRSDSHKRIVQRSAARGFKVFEDRIVPRLASNAVGARKQSLADFRDLTPDKTHFLQREAAKAKGFKGAEGASINEVRKYLRARGFQNPDDGRMLRGYLTDKGSLNKPWKQGDFNLFGFRQMGLIEARERGILDPTYRRGSTKDANSPYNKSIKKEFNTIAKGIRANGLDLNDATTPGLYVSRNGGVVDLNLIAGAGRRVKSFMAEQLQIPIIGYNPLEGTGSPFFRHVRERGSFAYVPAYGKQPFLGGQGDPSDHAYIWSRTKTKAKGTLFAIGRDAEGQMVDRELKGTYRPSAAAAKDIVANNTRWAVGERGRAPSPSRGGPLDASIDRVTKLLGVSGRAEGIKSRVNKASRALSVSDDQSQSIFGYASRFLNRKNDLNRPSVIARRLREDKLTSGAAPEELVDNLPKMLASIRRLGFGERTLRGSGNTSGILNDNQTKQMLGFGVGSNMNNIPNQVRSLIEDGLLNVDKINSPEQLKDVLDLLGRSSGGNQKVSSAYSALLQRYTRESDESFLGFIKGKTQTESIHTRMDEAKQDIYRFLAVRSDQMGQYAPAELMGKLQQLKSAKTISQSEYRESVAALLSIQAEVIKFSGHSAGDSNRAILEKMTAGLMRSDVSKQMLDPIANDLIGVGSGRLGFGKSALRKTFGSAEYEYDGTEYNPFGVDTVFVPTLGTTMERNPRQALASVFQANNWSNPNAFSGASIPGAHLFERINRYAGSFGLALDPTDFKGGLDFYGRGLVGKRALPIFAAGATLNAADRTLGGIVNERDDQGDRVYAPYFGTKAARGVAELNAIAAGLTPGGMSYDEKKEQILEGEVPIRSGRFWPLGNTPFRGEGVKYFRPSYYRRMASGYSYTDQSGFDSPLEKLAFGYDFSPLRPFDPYRFERQTAGERPYPVTGEYFTGPWGPLNPVLNASIGRLLKPKQFTNQEGLTQGLASYQAVGAQGAYLPEGFEYGMPGSGDSSFGIAGAAGSFASGLGGGMARIGTDVGEAGPPGANTYLAAGGGSLGLGSAMSGRQISRINSRYTDAAMGGPASPRVIQNATPITDRNLSFQAGELGYGLQEMFGIYGFAMGSLREGIGLGDQDFTPNNPVLQSSSTAYGVGRSFWDLNLGGLGDANLPTENPLGSFEFSEIVRRFIPRERSGIQTVNPLLNQMGQENPWLPGSDYFINFKTGDPYTQIDEGEMRLPGQAYERFYDVRKDSFGDYSMVDQFRILGDVAPWSDQYRAMNNMVEGYATSASDMADIERTRYQVGEMARENTFSDYKFKYSSPEESGLTPTTFLARKYLEQLSHQDTIINTKFLHNRTATEDWERDHVYGRSFPEWQHPIQDFIEPSMYRSTQKNPFTAAAYTSIVGSLFGRSASAKAMTSFAGGVMGFAAGAYGQAHEAITGERFLPEEYKQRQAVEEYSDILKYIKYKRLENTAQMSGDTLAAKSFATLSKKTMYGVDLNTYDATTFLAAVPKQKREHFEAMLAAPEQERGRILSTAPRLERRMLQAAWGMRVEDRPNLNEYFEDRELPEPGWEGWDPRVSDDVIKIKVAQSIGADLSEMGYYPQQVREANLLNPSYPNFNGGSGGNVAARMIRSVFQRGGTATVTPSYTPFAGDRLVINQGVGV